MESEDEESILEEIEKMEKENAKEILKLELEEEKLTPRSTSSSEDSESEIAQIEDLLSIILSEEAEDKKQAFDGLIKISHEMLEISKSQFDVIFQALVISSGPEGNFSYQSWIILRHILMLATECKLQLTETQVGQLMPKIGAIIMDGQSMDEERDESVHCLSCITQFHFSLLHQHKIIIPKSVAFYSGQMQLCEEMIKWAEEVIDKAELDVEDNTTMSILKRRSILLLYLVILGNVDKFSASLLEMTLQEFQIIDSRQFAEEWQKSSNVVQLLVVKTLLGSLSFCQLHKTNGKVIFEIVVLSDTTGVWQDLEFALLRLLNWEDNVKVTGALIVIKNISTACHTNGLLQFRGAINNFFPKVLNLVGKNTAAGATLKEMTLCRPDYVLNRDTRVILLKKLEKGKSDPTILETFNQLSAEDRMKSNAKFRSGLPKPF